MFFLLIFFSTCLLPGLSHASYLTWPIDCVPGTNCTITNYPDLDNNGRDFNNNPVGISGHQGTDIAISFAQMDAGMNIFAAADGVVLHVFDNPNRFDRCTSQTDHADCKVPSGVGVTIGPGPYCGRGDPALGNCTWTFFGGNVVIIKHPSNPEIFATRYDHFKSGSVTVFEGQTVSAGQIIGKVGSAGNSTVPHLHFEVWGSGGYYTYGPVISPWFGSFDTNKTKSLWKSLNNFPWLGVPSTIPTLPEWAMILLVSAILLIGIKEIQPYKARINFR